MAGCTAASIRENEIGGIGAYGKYHIASVITDCGIGVGGEVVKEHVAGLFGLLGWGSLVVGDFVQSDDDGRITATGV